MNDYDISKILSAMEKRHKRYAKWLLTPAAKIPVSPWPKRKPMWGEIYVRTRSMDEPTEIPTPEIYPES